MSDLVLENGKTYIDAQEQEVTVYRRSKTGWGQHPDPEEFPFYGSPKESQKTYLYTESGIEFWGENGEFNLVKEKEETMTNREDAPTTCNLKRYVFQAATAHGASARVVGTCLHDMVGDAGVEVRDGREVVMKVLTNGSIVWRTDEQFEEKC